MPIKSNYDQQNIFRRSWGNASKRFINEKLGKNMLVRGNVTGFVSIDDLGKNIAKGEVVEFNEFQINKSKDLHKAIKCNWVEVIEDRGALKRAIVAQGQEMPMNKEDTVQLARTMAKEMAREMMKDSPQIKELLDEIKDLKTKINQPIATNVISSIPDKIREDKIIIEEEKPENVVIDVDEGNYKISKNVGKVKEESSDISSSLEKMKKFRRKS